VVCSSTMSFRGVLDTAYGVFNFPAVFCDVA
jgi:hypothetical protein